MVTELQVKAPFITAHKELERQYYEYGLITKAEFDLLHGQNWNDMEAELIAEGYRQPPEPIRDLEAEMVLLGERIKALEDK